MYSVSKAAAHHLARQLAVELGPRNITTNAIAPGFFPSKLANGLIDLLGGERELSRWNPRKRLGEPEDIAGIVLYLSSRAGNYMCISRNAFTLHECSRLHHRNGEVICVDGGHRFVHRRQFSL